MGAYDYEIRQALREVVQEMKTMRREIETIRRRLTVSGGLTNATTRRGHLVVDGDKKQILCSACGCLHGDWYDDFGAVLDKYVGVCESCGAILSGDAEYVSGSGNE